MSKGLKFCPTQTNIDPSECRNDLDTFHNSLRIKEFFGKDKMPLNNKILKEKTAVKKTAYGTNPDLLKIRKRSRWRAPPGSANLETFISTNEIELGKCTYSKSTKQNISKNERQSLKDLAKDKTITIKPADKGGMIVVQNTVDYIKEAERQLKDTQTYQSLDHNPTKDFQKEIDETLTNLVEKGEISTKVQKMLSNNNPKTPNIYFLPKIHKNTRPPPGRPIVSANECPTETISAYVDLYLNPLVKDQKSYIKDTNDFINKIESIPNVEQEHILGTLDVTSLYTNIPNKEGLDSVRSVLNKNRNSLDKPKNEDIVNLLEIVLTKNNFQFNGNNYLQTGGTAMGTKVAPSYANLFMSELEEKLIETHTLKPKVWFRYIDDIFFIWEHGENSLKEWYEHLNNYHKTIRFTLEWSRKTINFLDTTVKKDKNNRLYTDLYTKPTDTNSYLRFDSAHPPKCKQSLPYSQFLRLRRICKDKTDFELNMNTKRAEFETKGYPNEILDRAEQEVRKKERSELLKANKKPVDESDRTFLITTYRGDTKYVPNIVRKNWDILARSSTTRSVHRSTLINGYRRPKNLRDYLVRAKTDYNPNQNMETEKVSMNICSTKNCKYCKRIDTSGQIQYKDRPWTCKKNVTCNSSNLIYCIECTKCNKRYVGQTKRKIKDRLREHMYSVKTNKDTDVAYHFNTLNHSVDDMKVYILDFIYSHPESKRANTLRLMIEYNWIQRLQSQSPNGMNILDHKYG